MIERLEQFIADPASARFEDLAVALWTDRETSTGVVAVAGWRDVPFAVPAASGDPALGDPPAAWPLLGATLETQFARGLLPAGRPPVLVLAPSPAAHPRSLDAAIGEHFLAQWGGEGSARAFGGRGIEAAAARSWVGAQQRRNQPVVIVATAEALAQWRTSLERMDLRFRLGAGSQVIVLVAAPTPPESAGSPERWVEERLAIPAARVIRAYAPAGMVSRCLGPAGPTPALYRPPHWVRGWVLDPRGHGAAEPGQPGRLALFDLAGEGTALHWLTSDVAVSDGEGFRLLAAMSAGEPPRS